MALLGIKYMNSSTLRQLWSAIEEVQPQTLLEADEKEITQKILREIRNKTILTNEEIGNISVYIQTRIPLIRDLAYMRSV